MPEKDSQFTENSIKITIYIKYLMGILNSSYQELADACQIKERSQIYQILNSGSSMKLSTFFKLCQGLQQINFEKGTPFEMSFFYPNEIIRKATTKETSSVSD